ncbi:MAG: YcjF family protein [Candidatus Izimaplasma sp.]|nr:YcjF family protein [Candidatus Izimaplasma bacterium]
MGRKKWWALIGIGLFIVVVFILVSNVIEVGIRLRNVHQYLEYTFYGLSGILFYVLILNPIRVILLSPTFTVDAMLTDSKEKHIIYRNAAKVLMKRDILTDKEKRNLQLSLNDSKKLRDALQATFKGSVHTKTRETIVENAKHVFISTALSQNGNLDMISTLIINIKLIREIVEISGFRPSYPYLIKLSTRVLVASLIAEGIEEMELSEVLPTKFTETITDVPFLKTISSSVLGGVTNAMLTCRVGVITEKYLYNDNKLLDRKQIRKQAYKDTITLMPVIIGDSLSFFPKSIAKIIARPFRKAQKKES